MARLVGLYGTEQVRVQVRAALAELRRRLDEAGAAAMGEGELERALERLPGHVAEGLSRRLGTGMRRVLNATGILLHTNLGRAPLPREVGDALPPLLTAYCDLEMELESGRRADRNRRARELLCALTGAEAAVVVNNNAGALVLVLAAFARGREVVVSRGELVEIGGSFRIPDILEAAGVRLVEVGTTNRTRIADYGAAVNGGTGLLLKVFPSNYRISGFTESAAIGELVELSERSGVPLLVDEGSGLLRPHPSPQLRGHTSLSELMAAGCGLACGSGDKLLGGPQAGILVGRQALVERCARHPLYRALRPDRAALAALETVLRRHLAGELLPLDRLWPEPAGHRRRLEAVAARLGAEIVPAEAFLGGGAAPESPVLGEALALPGEERLLPVLRRGSPPLVGYVRAGTLVLDLRTVDPADDEALIEAVLAARARCPAPLVATEE